MRDSPTLHKFPEGSDNRDYDVFEELNDGSTVWRACVVGMENVESKLRELALESNNKFFALSLHDGIRPPTVRRFKERAMQVLCNVR